MHEKQSVFSAQSLALSANGRKNLKAESTIGDYLKNGWEAGSLAIGFSSVFADRLFVAKSFIWCQIAVRRESPPGTPPGGSSLMR